MESLAVIKAVADELVRRGYRASFEHPGFIQIQRYGLVFDFGTANGTWDGDVEGYADAGVVPVGIPGDSQDVNAIADGVAAAVEKCGCPDSVTNPPDLSPYAQTIWNKVMAELQHAEGMYGPQGEDYVALMEALAAEAKQRIANYREWSKQ